MWLSERINKNEPVPEAESGKITLSSPENWEAFASRKVRNINAYAPYGYSSVAPLAEEVLLIPVSDTTAAVGTKCKSEGLEAGEIIIKSLGGAQIMLKNDGSIVLNGKVTINREGKVTGIGIEAD